MHRSSFRLAPLCVVSLALCGCESVSMQATSLAADLAEISSGVVCDTAQSVATRTRDVEQRRALRRESALEERRRYEALLELLTTQGGPLAP